MISGDFKGDWYGAITNQCGHYALGGAIPVYLPLIGWAFSGWLAVPMAALVYWVIVELWMQGNIMWRDSLMDTAHVMSGAAFFAYVMQHIPAGDYTAQVIFSIWAALLAFEGWSKR